MVSAPSLPDDLEAKAQELAARIRQRADEDILALARLLVSKEERHIFGDTEFEARQLMHRIGAKAFAERLKKQTTAIKDPGSSVPPADKTPSSRATGRKHP